MCKGTGILNRFNTGHFLLSKEKGKLCSVSLLILRNSPKCNIAIIAKGRKKILSICCVRITVLGVFHPFNSLRVSGDLCNSTEKVSLEMRKLAQKTKETRRRLCTCPKLQPEVVLEPWCSSLACSLFPDENPPEPQDLPYLLLTAGID